MKVLHVNATDTIGGAAIAAYRLHKSLSGVTSIKSKMLVGRKVGNDKDTIALFRNHGSYIINRLFHRITCRCGRDGLVALTNLQKIKWYIDKADVIHLHNIHGGYFPLQTLLKLSDGKPVFWTLHDMWGLTGGCCFSYGCLGFENDCSQNFGYSCPHKHAVRTWKKKKKIYSKANFKIIVSSVMMHQCVRQSTLMQRFNVTHIPFGIDLKVFRAMDRKAAKKALRIPDDTIVIGFRASTDEQKGLKYVIESMTGLDADRKICILTMGEKRLVEPLRGRYAIVELGLIQNEHQMAKAYNAMDIFLMPSIAESFGLMAMEAMACGTPTIAFDKTVLEQTLFAQQGGLAVPHGDSAALKMKIEELIKRPAYRRHIGKRALTLAIENYDITIHLAKVVEAYQQALVGE